LYPEYLHKLSPGAYSEVALSEKMETIQRTKQILLTMLLVFQHEANLPFVQLNVKKMYISKFVRSTGSDISLFQNMNQNHPGMSRNQRGWEGKKDDLKIIFVCS